MFRHALLPSVWLLTVGWTGLPCLAEEDGEEKTTGEVETELREQRLEKSAQWQEAMERQKEALENERMESAKAGDRVLAATMELAKARRELIALYKKALDAVQSGKPEEIEARLAKSADLLQERMELLIMRLDLARLGQEARNLAALSDKPEHKQILERIQTALNELSTVYAQMLELRKQERDLRGYVEKAMQELKSDKPSEMPAPPHPSAASQPTKP